MPVSRPLAARPGPTGRRTNTNRSRSTSRNGRSRNGRNGRNAAALLALLLSALLLVSGCGGTDSGGDRSAADGRDRGAAPAEAGTGAKEDAPGSAQQDGDAAGDGATGKQPADTNEAPKPAQTHVIRTATLRIEAKGDFTDAVDRARQLTVDAGGYVGSESTERDEGERERSRMTLRIPPDQYEESLDELAKLGKVLERRTSAKDVTDEVVDVDSRIKTQRASVSRVQKLMDRAEKISDIVTLEEELRTRQADLESLLAQANSLASRTGMATVTLTLTEPAKAKAKAEEKDDGAGAAIVDALGDGWHAFYVAFRGLLVVLAAVLPFAVTLLLLYLLLRRFLPRPARPIAVGPPVPGLTPYAHPAPAPAAPAPAAEPSSGSAARAEAPERPAKPEGPATEG